MARRRSARGPADPAGFSIDQVVELAVRHNLAELEVEAAGTRIRIVREHAPVASGSRVEAAPALAAALPQSAPESVESTAHLLTVEAPMVGTFYRAPEPGARPFVEVGQVVSPTTTVCIIEVMKLMNSIPAGCNGTVTQVLVEDAEAVDTGQVLIVIDPKA